jgi:hypothetical protein
MRDDQARQKRTVQAVYSELCEQFSETMYLYALAQQREEDSVAAYAEFKKHIEHCSACTEAYQDLLMLLKDEDSAWITPEDLPVLPPPWGEMAQDREQVEALLDWNGVRVWVDRQRETLVRLLVDLSGMENMTPQIQTRSQTTLPSGQQAEREWLVDTTQVEGIQDAELRLSVAPDQTMPDHHELRVEISIPDRWPDFSGAIVYLHTQQANTPSQMTGRSGTVRFGGLTIETIRQARVEIILP